MRKRTRTCVFSGMSYDASNPAKDILSNSDDASTANTTASLRTIARPSTTTESDSHSPRLVNLESHQLVWCDGRMNNDTRVNLTVVLAELRKIVDYTKLFDDIEECFQHLQDTRDAVTFLVISGRFGQTLVPRISHFKNIRSIHIYCRNEALHRHWSSQYDKVSVHVRK